jgi:hypothetical protein
MIGDLGSGFDNVWEGGDGIGAPGQPVYDVTVTKPAVPGRPVAVEESFRVSATSPQGALALAQETQGQPGLQYRVHPLPEEPQS